MINEGDKASSMTVTASDGSSVNLASPGQPLVLYFYPRTIRPVARARRRTSPRLRATTNGGGQGHWRVARPDEEPRKILAVGLAGFPGFRQDGRPEAFGPGSKSRCTAANI
jgi:hypothetical protein